MWLLMMTFCLGPDCNAFPIDEFESQMECKAAQSRADARQHMIKSEMVTFFCQKDGERRVWGGEHNQVLRTMTSVRTRSTTV